MDRKKIKKALSGLSVVGLAASVGLGASGCKSSCSSCGKSSCGKGAAEKSSCGKGSGTK